MSLRRAAKRDCNEPRIVAEFERLGAVVQRLSDKGIPDLLVSYLRVLHLVEVKWENAQLTEDQLAWHDLWEKSGAQRPEIVRTEAHARKLVRMWTQEFARNAAHRPDLEDDLAKSPEALESERESGRVG